MKCKKYEEGACKNVKCGFAHEGDGYAYLVEYRKVRRAKVGEVGLGVERVVEDGVGEDGEDGDNEEGGVGLS